jgi:hypothetical protein
MHQNHFNPLPLHILMLMQMLIDYVEELVAIVLQPDCSGGMPKKW